jgi:hypothetical protein
MPAVEPATDADCDYLPDWDRTLPDYGTPWEMKAEDWGWLDGRLVAVDYSTPVLADAP